MPCYEISNHARPGSESRHNLIYWRQGDWAAIGPGAHGRLTLPSGRVATEAYRDPAEWLDAVRARGRGESLREGQSLDDRALEYLLMSMRLVEGMDLARHRALARADLPAAAIADMAGMGLVRQVDGRLAATGQGRPILNAILRELAA